jgi:hypothetical protein
MYAMLLQKTALVGRLVCLAACLGFASGNLLLAQSTACAGQNSFQFPLWNDGAKWNLPGLYNSIQLADIDGDGQDELLGYGPFGVEVWHWEPSGEGWVQMPASLSSKSEVGKR